MKGKGTFLISKSLLEEEVKLLDAREGEEEEQEKEPNNEACLNDMQFTKLDELLTQTQMYTEFLLEKMEDITNVSFQASFIDESSKLRTIFFTWLIKFFYESHC